MSEEIKSRTEPVAPLGFNHLVLNVRNLDESHDFWVNVLGFTQVGELKRSSMSMRFYSGKTDGEVNHHDLAMVEVPDMPPVPEWAMSGTHCAVNHIAITYPDRESWLEQVKFMEERGSLHKPVRIDHGMTHSVYCQDPNGYAVEVLYELPEEVWRHDIDGALNYADILPADELLTDTTEYETNFS